MAKIENRTQYEAMMARIEELLAVVDDNTPEDDKNSIELALVSALVAEYEDEHFPVSTPSLIEVLKLRMYEMGISQSALSEILGISPSKISEILSGKNEPTLKQAKRMVTTLHISPSVVLGV